MTTELLQDKREEGELFGESQAGIIVENGVLKITQYEHHDPDVVRYFSHLEDENSREDALTNCLRIGVAAFHVRSVVEPTRFIEARLSDLESSLDSHVRETRDAILEEVQKKFGTNGEVNEFLEKMFGRGSIYASLLDSTRRDSPLFQLKEDLRLWFSQIEALLAQKKGIEIANSSSTVKGFEFEDYVDQVIGEIVSLSKGSLQYEIVGNKPGSISRSKKGDRVITISDFENARIVIELKDVVQIGLPEIHRIAGDALKNRAAHYSIIVVRNSAALPVGVGMINEYEDHLVLGLTANEGNENLVVHRELLAMGLHLAKIRVLSQVRRRHDPDFDAASFQSHFDKIHSLVQSLNKLGTHVGNCREQLSLIESVGRGAKTEIELELAALQSLLKSEEYRVTVPVEGEVSS